MATQLWAIVLVLVVSVIGAVGSLFLKKGSKTVSKNIFKLIKNDMLLIGVLMYAITVPIYIIALKGGELSVLFPIVSTTYIWSSLLAMYFLNEKMNKFKWMGIFLIIIGVMFIGLGS